MISTTKKTYRRLPDGVAEAIEAILDHFWDDEVRDYLAVDRQQQERHIFNDMLTVRKWLRERNARRGTP
jgi:hypothetical protein